MGGFIPTGPLPSSYPVSEPSGKPPEELLTVLRDSGGALLELPIRDPSAVGRMMDSGGGSPRFQVEAMYGSIFHWRSLLNGYQGYWPADFPDRMGIAEQMPSHEAVALLRKEAGLELVLVHIDRVPPEQRAQWLRLANGDRLDEPVRLIAREGSTLLFRIQEAS